MYSSPTVPGTGTRVAPRHRLSLVRILLREALRAVGVQLRLLLYLPFRHRHRQVANELLAAAGKVDADERQRRNEEARQCIASLVAAEPHHVFLACGEPSGERHAVALTRALRAALPDVRLTAFGGHELENAGVSLLDNLGDHAVMGIKGVLAQLPFYCQLIARYLAWLDAEKPDLVILIDNPGLNMLLAAEARRRGIPVLYYILPQYWAWGPWRMHRFRRSVDAAISILPFEPPFFRSAGVPTAFAGHPLLAEAPQPAPEPREPLLVLLPGSRRAEIDRQLVPFLDVYARLRKRHPEARAVVAQHNPRQLAHIERRIAEHKAAGREWPGLTIHAGDPFPLLARARLAFVKSGTSTLQTAMCRTPQVVVYKLDSFVETFFAHNFLSVPWIAAPNLVAGRRILPEFCFHSDRRWDEVLAAALELWVDGDARTKQLTELDRVRELLTGPGAAVETARWLSTKGSRAKAPRRKGEDMKLPE